MGTSDNIPERYKNLEIRKKQDKEKEYPEIAMEVGKFVQEIGKGIWHCSVHKLPVSPLIVVFLYTMEGQKISTKAFSSACFRHSTPLDVTKTVVKEIGGSAASYITIEAALEGLAILGVSSNPGFWVILGLGIVGGTVAPWAYGKLVNLVWKISSDQYEGVKPIYATPNLEDMGFATHRDIFHKVRTVKTLEGEFGGMHYLKISLWAVPQTGTIM